jgi:hypothetical protein
MWRGNFCLSNWKKKEESYIFADFFKPNSAKVRLPRWESPIFYRFEREIAYFMVRGRESFVDLSHFLRSRLSDMNSLLFRILPVMLVSILGIVSCRTTNNPPMEEPPAEVPPSEYGQPGEEIPMPPGEGGRPGGRFGYTGEDRATAPDPPRPGNPREVRDVEPAPKPETPKPPKPSGPPSSADMQFANKVPGNPLVVTLPGRNASLGKISIEKYDSSGNPTGQPLKRGTQVQIPDPNNPGKKIYFKVP